MWLPLNQSKRTTPFLRGHSLSQPLETVPLLLPPDSGKGSAAATRPGDFVPLGTGVSLLLCAQPDTLHRPPQPGLSDPLHLSQGDRRSSPRDLKVHSRGLQQRLPGLMQTQGRGGFTGLARLLRGHTHPRVPKHLCTWWLLENAGLQGPSDDRPRDYHRGVPWVERGNTCSDMAEERPMSLTDPPTFQPGLVTQH